MAHTVYKNKAGKRLPSVTTIIGTLGWNRRVIEAWIKKMFRDGKDPDQITDEACSIGSLVHSAIEHHIFGQDEFDVPDGVDELTMIKVGQALSNYIEWEKAHDVQYLESELQVISEVHQYAGTADCLAYVDGVLTLLDFKTSKSVHAEMLLQLAAYREGIHETTDYQIEQCAIVHIDKNAEDDNTQIGLYKIENSSIDTAWIAFEMVLWLHKEQSAFNKILKGLVRELVE